MKHLDGLLKLIINEIGSVEQNGKFRSREEIDSVYKLIDIAKDIYCIWNYEDEASNESYAYEGRSYRGSSYDDGMSYARGRNAKRDSMGRYSRTGDMSYRGYSRGDAKQEYIDELQELMQKTSNEQTRQSIQRMIQQMEHD